MYFEKKTNSSYSKKILNKRRTCKELSKKLSNYFNLCVYLEAAVSKQQKNVFPSRFLYIIPMSLPHHGSYVS